MAKNRKDLSNEEKPILAELMVDQLEVADLIIINKTDLVSPEVLR